MTSTAQGAISSGKMSKTGKIVDFAPERLKAPFFLRCAALFIDYMILLAVPLGWLLFERFFGDGGANITIGNFVWFLVVIFWLINFLLLPLLRGQTIGKMLTGITIVNRDGTDMRLGGILLRNILGYLLTALTLGLGFLISAVNSSGRSLHDFVARTIVVRGHKRQVTSEKLKVKS